MAFQAGFAQSSFHSSRILKIGCLSKKNMFSASLNQLFSIKAISFCFFVTLQVKILRILGFLLESDYKQGHQKALESFCQIDGKCYYLKQI